MRAAKGLFLSFSSPSGGNPHPIIYKASFCNTHCIEALGLRPATLLCAVAPREFKGRHARREGRKGNFGHRSDRRRRSILSH